jgi:hypothetical protein
MYRHVHVRGPMAARMLEKRLSHLSTTRGTDVWRWVQTFHEHLPPKTSEVTIALFLVAINLIELQATIPFSSAILMTLRRSCPSLRLLKVCVDTRAMAQVEHFEHVTQLRIVPHRSPSSTDALRDVPAWNMPAVTHFWWQESWNQVPHGARFLSQCRFSHLTHLDVEHYHRGVDLEGDPHICRFLDAHRNIAYLRLWVKDDRRLNIVPFVRARNFRVGCINCYPPRAFVSLLRPEVKNLELEFNGFSWEEHEQALTTSLWELLTQFAVDDDKPPTLETIHLLKLTRDFDSGKRRDNPMKEEPFRCTLRSHALGLNARGIRIVVDDAQICV